MKKILAFIIAAAIMLSVVAFSASAAGTFGDYEQKLIDLIGTDTEIKIDGELAKIHVPDNYVNQAKTYFASTEGDINEEQYKEIVSYIEAGKKQIIDAVEADHSLVLANGEVDIAHTPKEVKKSVLEQGQKACEVVDMKLEYTGEKVVITTDAGEQVFSDEPIVKTTGADMSVAFGMAFVMFAVAVTAVFAAKKVELF